MATKSKELFLQELKDEYKAQFELSDTLEGKSGQLITVCGIFVPLIFGFTTTLIGKLHAYQNLEYTLTILLMISLTVAVVSIFFSILALRIKQYSHAFLHHDFYKEDKLSKEEIEKYGKLEEDKIYDEILESYLESNKHNLNMNVIKARNVKIAQFLFLGSLAIVPIIVTIFFVFKVYYNLSVTF